VGDSSNLGLGLAAGGGGGGTGEPMLVDASACWGGMVVSSPTYTDGLCVVLSFVLLRSVLVDLFVL